MTIRTILHYPDKRLREKSTPVQAFDQELQTLLEDMAETMYAAPGVGLAAPQIGQHKRVFIIDIADADSPSQLIHFINPEITKKEGTQEFEEGCLSFPTLHETIKRAAHIKVKAFNRTGQEFEIEAQGLLSVAIQHEFDHLNGILMIDHLGPLSRRLALRKIEKRAASQEAHR